MRGSILLLPLVTVTGNILAQLVVSVNALVAGPFLCIFIALFGPLVCIFSELLPCVAVGRKPFLYPDFNVVLPVQRNGVVTLCLSFVPI